MTLSIMEFYHAGVLITGGLTHSLVVIDPSLALKSAEIYLPDTKTSCSLPQMPKMRRYHTQDGGLVCGGELEFGSHQNSNSHILTLCDTWDNGTWNRSHTLALKRRSHVSWSTSSGVYLIGGARSSTSIEIVKKDGAVVADFQTKYSTV